MLYEFLSSRLQGAHIHEFSLFCIPYFFFLFPFVCYFNVLQMENSWAFIIFPVVPPSICYHLLLPKTLKTWTDSYLFV